MTNELPPNGIDDYQEPVTAAERAMQMMDRISKLEKLSGLKDVIDKDPWVRHYLEEQLEALKTDVHNRIVDLYPDELSERDAKGMLLLLGTVDYSDDRRLRLSQQVAVSEVSSKLAKGYKDKVPNEEQSRVFEKLLWRGAKGAPTDSGPMLRGALRSIVDAGTYTRPIKNAEGKDTRKKERVAPSPSLAHSILLTESMRILEYYYPPRDD